MELSLLAAIIVVPSALIAICQSAHARFARLRRAPGDGASIEGRYRIVALNGVVAMAVYFSSVVLGGGWLFDAGRASRWYMPVLVLLLYDLGYYWLHRALHWRPLMRSVHWVHHRALHPTAIDSLYLHPLDTLAGLGLLLACIAVIGPLGPGAFAVSVVSHSALNVVVHANLRLPSRVAWLTNQWSARHDAHHSGGGDYGTITPLWDWLFGTSSRAARP